MVLTFNQILLFEQNYENFQNFLTEFFLSKFSVYFNRRAFLMVVGFVLGVNFMGLLKGLLTVLLYL